MTLEHILPREVRRLMEKHGIEGDSISRHNDDLFIECDDIEVAFELRELMLAHRPCCLISHPKSKKPTLLIHSILNQ
jgi:hypothetical protein